MEAKRNKVIINWPQPKSIYNIQVFLDFANFYWRFIQGFSKIAAPFTSILKTTGLLDEPALSKINGSKSATSRNINSRPASRKNNSNDEVNRFDVDGNNVEHTKKLGKSKSKKTSKSQNLAKSEKKSSKSGNLPNFDAM